MKARSLLVATAALGLLAAAPAVANEGHDDGGTVKCSGINSCAGKGQCAAADGSHDCSGKNSCKGKGWIETSAKECAEKGGTVQD